MDPTKHAWDIFGIRVDERNPVINYESRRDENSVRQRVEDFPPRNHT